MKIVKVEDLHCDAGWRVNSFLKITTDEGIVGWSEYMEGYGAQGLTGVILKLAERFLIGQDPRPVERHSAHLYAATRQAAGGVNQMAIAAIENALVDIKAKALGVPVYEMLGGPVRDRLQLYWSHCGTYRARHADRIREWAGVDPVRSLDDIVALGEEVRRKGFKGLKTNLIRFDRDKPYMYGPGTGNPPGFPELNVDHRIVDAAVAQLEAFRRGAGRDVGLHLDTNFNYKIDGYRQIGAGAGAARPGVARDRPLRPGRPGIDPPLRPHPDLVLRIIVWPASVPALFREPVGRLRDHRRGVERHPRILEDRGDGRRLRGQCRAA